MPQGRIRDWTGAVGKVLDANGVWYTFFRNDLQNLQPDELQNEMVVEFDSAKAGSSWQARNVRTVGTPSAGARHRPTPTPVPAEPVEFGAGIEGLPEPISLVPLPVRTELLALLPLPETTRRAIEAVPVRERHPGLQLDRYLKPVRDQKAQRQVLMQVADIPPTGPLFAECLARRSDLFESLPGAVAWSRTTSSALTLHLSRASALENAGICLHPIHGFVTLPGSGIKGLTRAYAEEFFPERSDDILRVFGDEESAGGVIFHDAWPEKWPKLIVDIVNNHHGDYYQGDSGPGDWIDPVPVYFLAVPAGATFGFAISPRRPEEAESAGLLTLARQWLDGALSFRGVGAKTNAGYGCFSTIAGVTLPASPRYADFSATLTLSTPAYLAGALQRQEDCDLRPATVRGLLRWWWRTLHSGFVDVNTLRKMEAVVWGDTAAGGAVQVRLERITPNLRVEASPYKKEGQSRSGELILEIDDRFLERHGIPRRAQNATQGLDYAGYGMDLFTPDELTRKKSRRQRYCAQAGTSWRIALTARERGHLSAASLLKQAKAALWWWTELGGVGSRSRKGFGSINDPAELKDFEGGRWLSLGKEFRKEFGLPETEFNPGYAQSPAIFLMRELAKSLNQNPWLDVPTDMTDPWRVLNAIGGVMQEFAQASPDTGHGKHNEAKRYLGLPREIHGPMPQALRHQTTHTPPIDLEAIHGERHAAPIFYHVAGEPGKPLTIRVAVFPTATLRPYGMSEAAGLKECTALHRELLVELSHALAPLRRK